jgi:hypothetical protein
MNGSFIHVAASRDVTMRRISVPLLSGFVLSRAFAMYSRISLPRENNGPGCAKEPRRFKRFDRDLSRRMNETFAMSFQSVSRLTLSPV